MNPAIIIGWPAAGTGDAIGALAARALPGRVPKLAAALQRIAERAGAPLAPGGSRRLKLEILR